MAPLFMIGGGGGAKHNGKTTAPAETAAGGRTSDDGVDRSHGLWDYLHHGLDGYSSSDLRLLGQYNSSNNNNEREPTTTTTTKPHQSSATRTQQQHQQQLSSSSTYHQTLYELRPDSSKSHHNLHLHRTSSESAGASATWTLRSGKSHEKTNSGSSKKTTATTATNMTIPTICGVREREATTAATLSPPDGLTSIVVPPPVSPSTASFGAEMTKQEFEALPEAIQRKVSYELYC
ncbi:hypothetical protein CGLO_04570 [Colletotrichum gloeosporioides Cg-14]|uniref:Uncharacterized protein n=1 Tax=Colletotrichum gloeosporioides (strain Cg-14) TaxID=1237896 RepID=T0KTT9_COLGC|nr:hypothetical protein CGLO_04570 [Colletotrichum gloeosporioides Cg-14]